MAKYLWKTSWNSNAWYAFQQRAFSSIIPKTKQILFTHAIYKQFTFALHSHNSFAQLICFWMTFNYCYCLLVVFLLLVFNKRLLEPSNEYVQMRTTLTHNIIMRSLYYCAYNMNVVASPARFCIFSVYFSLAIRTSFHCHIFKAVNRNIIWVFVSFSWKCKWM